jgi:hypothetical protein
MGENLALIRESRRREPSMKAISATFPTLLPSPLDRFRFDFMAALPFSGLSLPPSLPFSDLSLPPLLASRS